MKLGIIVVYLLKENGGPLLQLHLDRIARHTGVPYTIYGAPLRLLPQFRAVLEQRPDVKLVDVPPIAEAHVSREHSYYLDALVQAALADGVTHLCALHVDSFPVRDGWAEDLASRLDEHHVAAAIFRAENGDRVLPMPAGLMFTRQFQERYQPPFYVSREVIASAEYQRYRKQFEAEDDSGIGYAFEIYRQGLSWHRLLRSNKHNEHYLISGIYGDTFYHLGAAAREQRRFRGDFRGQGASALLQWRQRLDATTWLPAGIRSRLRRLLPDRDALLAEAEAHNHQCLKTAFERLLADPDTYIDLLRYGKSKR